MLYVAEEGCFAGRICELITTQIKPLYWSSNMALLYLEDFCESIETLPQEVKVTLANMRAFDLRVQSKFPPILNTEKLSIAF